ncbi:MAG: glycoside hydrolase family 88 protein [Sphingomonas sp.]|uniref:glycoside hydrolase family 88/105 protein n=1 Tax=Sphingomonas sp. TaxID=28214 RepID=UPI0022729BBE|nr:glycoside hydrolase family 88 protein [Sphingomonas sp.]MCX8474960.1 glycoside hydrolase family 88 protein [Sphingomonas sp.]
MIRKALLAAGLFTLGACAESGRPAGPGAAAVAPSPAEVGGRAAGAYLARRDIVPLRTSAARGVHYADVASGYGAARLAAATGNRALLDRVVARERVASAFPNSANHVDVSVYGTWPLEIARQTGDAEALRRGLALADNQWAQLGEDQLTAQARYWIDDVWMIGSLQVQAYRASKDARYLDRAALMVRRYVDRLQQPDGLFFHGPEAHFYWGRGNGWVAAGFAEILTDLPAAHPERAAIEAGYRKMMAALLANQAEDGMWRQLIDRPESWKETSGTAMFGFAMARGVRLGILADPAYARAYRRAWQALARYVQPDGQVTEVCVGTNKADNVAHYLDRPRATGDLHGQAALLWFAAELAGSGRS